jgi:hypothetical protein
MGQSNLGILLNLFYFFVSISITNSYFGKLRHNAELI